MLPIVLGLLAFGLIVAFALAFGRRRGGIQTRSGVDGFWISTRGIRGGTRIRYSCLVRSSRHNGEVIVEPGPDEMFVYTGNTPSDIDLQVLGYGGGVSTVDDDDDIGVISTGASYSSQSSTDDSFSGSSGGSDYGSRSASAESSASDAGNGFPPAY